MHVPPNLIAVLKEELAKEATHAPMYEETVAALGGDPRCFERFLIARDLNVNAAAAMFRATLEFRSREVAEPMPPALHAELMKWWPGSIIGRAIDGSPVTFFKLNRVDPKGLCAAVTEENFRRFYISWLEVVLKHQVACSNHGMVEIYDLRGTSFSQVYLPGFRMLARVLSVGQAFYPELLSISISIGTPRFITVAWAIISRVLSERTRAKCYFLSDDGAQHLQALMGAQVDKVEQMHHEAMRSGRQEGLAWLARTAEVESNAKPAAMLECDASHVRLRQVESSSAPVRSLPWK